MPGTLISPEHAARAGVEGLDHGERVVVPGLPMRVGMLASRYIPHALKLPALERFMRPGAGERPHPPPPRRECVTRARPSRAHSPSVGGSALACGSRAPPGASVGARPPAGQGPYPSNPIRCARCTASARFRARSLRYSALVCSLTVCGDR